MAYVTDLSSLIHCDIPYVDQSGLLGHYCSNATLTALWGTSYKTDHVWWHSEQNSCQFCPQITCFKNCYTTDTVVLDVVVSCSTKKVLWCLIIVTSWKYVIGGVILFPIACSFRTKSCEHTNPHSVFENKNSRSCCLEACYEKKYKLQKH